jgi:hypothetical protein
MSSLSRGYVSKWAGITLRQLDHFGTAGVAAADVGGERKRFSVAEARMAVIAGRCLKYGMTPRALVEPIDWLRNHARWPAIENLPKHLAEIDAELSADRLRSIEEFPFEEKVKVVAPRLFGFSTGRYVHIQTHKQYEAIRTDYEAALKSDDLNQRSHAEEATKRANKMLSEPRKWSIEEIYQAERALRFEMACRGEADLFFHLATGEESWKTFVTENVSRIEGEATWLVIDIRTLFRERGALIA